jgi:DNA-binding winged helix-turn-helix (wHTH) protein
MDKQSGVSYRFGAFLLCPHEHLLLSSGKPIPLKPKAFDTLLVLVESAGHLITKEDLMKKVWSDTVVEEGNLSLAVHQARKALDRGHDGPSYIVTIPRRGYRFVEPVIVVHDETVLSAGSSAGEEIVGPEVVLGEEIIARDDSLKHQHDPSQGINGLLGGHTSYAVITCAIYAGLFSTGLLIQVAYQFDDYERKGLVIALFVFLLVFVSSVTAFTLDWRRTVLGRDSGLGLQCLVFMISGAAAFGTGCLLLPGSQVVQANFQTYTAQAAYLKDTCYFLALALFYLIIPFHFILSMQREVREGRHRESLSLLSADKLSVPPRGTIYPKLWVLLLLLVGLFSTAIVATTRLFSNLTPGTHVNLYMHLVLVRWMLYFGLAILALAWYHRELNDIKRKCVAHQGVTQKPS